MSEEIFPYDQWVNEALLKVLARALEQLSNTGPMGDHHFFINIQTNHPDVDIPNFLRTQYPKEITIVLQHQFEELIVNEYGFEVSLSFSGKKSRLKIPFSSVISFADPSVDFGLQIGIPTTNTEIAQPRSEA
ncbi:ClpXP protease specificity-enhancing factor SspB, partial [Gammaproteobacteria bacterium]|nr:ClpXP protease specificity-enhancing factor SspB [Gammaproteobacteria bacterium]